MLKRFPIRLIPFLFAGLLVIDGLLPAVAEEGNPIQILQLSRYPAEAIAAQTGETWLGLFETGKTHALKPVTLKVETVPGPSGTGTVKRLTVAEGVDPLFLVRGSEAFQAGPVKTLSARFTGFFGDRPASDVLPTTQLLPLSETSKLIVDSLPAAGNLFRLMLIFVDGDLAQMLDIPEIPIGPGIRAGLVWAGDLDRDGYGDLLLQLGAQPQASHLALFLSTPAEPGDLLKKVAEFGVAPAP